MRPIVRRPVTVAVLTVVLVLTGCGDGDVGESPSPSPRLTTAPQTTAGPAPQDSPTGTSPGASPTGIPTSTDSPTAGTTADVAAMSFTDCQADRFSVGYPQDWTTNEPTDLVEACRIFHPGEIDLPDQPQDRDLHWAASLYIDAVAWEDVESRESVDEVVEERETTVAGQRAMVTETRGTGQALLPEGEQRYAYVVDLDGEILVAVTHTVGDTEYERDKQVLDRMMDELALTTAG